MISSGTRLLKHLIRVGRYSDDTRTVDQSGCRRGIETKTLGDHVHCTYGEIGWRTAEENVSGDCPSRFTSAGDF